MSSSSSKNPPEVQTNPADAGRSGGGDELRREGQGTGGVDQATRGSTPGAVSARSNDDDSVRDYMYTREFSVPQ